MRTVKQRLKSNRGASLFLAIVFFMFCFFVGGTVLAAATSNAGRAATRQQRQASVYAQRSAAMLLRDQFTNPAQMTITLQSNTIIRVTAGTSTTGVNSSTTYSSIIKALGTQTNLQKIICQAIACKFIQQNAAEPALTGGTEESSSMQVTNAPTFSVASAAGRDTGTVTLSCDDVSINMQYRCDDPAADATDTQFCTVVMTFSLGADASEESQYVIRIPVSVNTVHSVGGEPTSYSGGVSTINRIDNDIYTFTCGKPTVEKP